MKPFQIDTFKDIKMPCALKAAPSGRLAFIIRQPDMKNNRYRSDLYLLRAGKPQRLTSCGNVADFWWRDDDAVLLTLSGNANKQAGDRKPGRDKHAATSTTLYRLNITHPDELRKYLCLPGELAELAPLPDGQLLYTAKDGRKRLPSGGLRRDEADYEVIDTLPFWENGEGFTDAACTRLNLFDGKTHRALTDTLTNVSAIQLYHNAKYVYFFAVTQATVMPVRNRLMRLEWKTGCMEDLSVATPFSHEKFAVLKGGDVVVFGSGQQQYGINQNGAFYLQRAPWNNPRPLYDGGDYSAWCSVGTDLSAARESVWAAAGETVYWLTTIDDSAHIMSINTVSGLIDRVAIANGAVFEFCLSRSGSKMSLFCTAMRDLSGPELYRLSKNGDEKRLSCFNGAALSSFSVVKPERISFHNATGTDLKGFVLRPHGIEQSNQHPAILYIHGGPKTVYGSILFHELQYLSGQGYGVVFANPTGSDGRGDAFADIRGRYGTTDYDDIMCFLDAALQANPWIDPKRVGVAGGSYGGFLVNWIIGHTDAFAAAVSQRGISNWSTMANLSDIGYYFEPDQAGATTWSDPAALWNSSPLKYADRVKTPTLFLHSDEDYRCPLPEALQLYTALQLFGVETRLCLFHGENHELSRSGKPRHRVARLAEITNWFDHYLK